MKTGLEYALSEEKRNFDVAIAAILTPPAMLGNLAIGRYLARGRQDHRVFFRQDRNGQAGQVFSIYKLCTLDGTTTQPINRLSSLLRRSGIDELPQMTNVLRGEMSLTGHRPLPVNDYEAVMERASPGLRSEWEEVVQPTRPGLISSFVILHHQHSDKVAGLADEKLIADIQDVEQASLAHDVQLLSFGLRATLAGRT